MDADTLKRLYSYLKSRDNSFDPEMEMQLQQLWNDGTEMAPSPELWGRLRRTIRGRLFAYRLLRMARYVGVVLVAALVFAGGYLLAPRTITEETSLPQKYVLVTAEGSVGSYILPDGTDVWLNGGSRLEYDADFATNRRATLMGEAYFDVEHDSVHPFTLSMANISVEVLGTQFDARCYPDGSYEDVVLRQGSVKVQSRQNNEHLATLVPNERLIFNPLTGAGKVNDVEALNYCRWMEERLVFSNVPLADIITNLERKYRVEIEIAPERLKQRRLTLTVSHEPLTDVLAVVNALTNTRSHFKNANSIVLE